tara:strand:- start:233 stop:436 length:204 start_codon:yes stop_codon:yes gene_type:complete
MTTDLKIYLLNAVALVANFSQLDMLLKIVLTAVAIGYTINKWFIMSKNYKQFKQHQNDKKSKGSSDL